MSRSNPYFDFLAFSKDLYDYGKRHAVYRDWENGNNPTVERQISDQTGLIYHTVKTALVGYPCSLRTLCILADYADLSLDKYRL